MTKQEFYNNIDWQAPLCRDFFMKLYGYGLYDREFLATVLNGFQSRGRGHVRHVYDIFVELEEIRQKEILLPISQDLSRQINANYEKKVKEYRNDRDKTRNENWHGFKGFPPIY